MSQFNRYLLLLLVTASVTLAQVLYGGLLGAVTDPSGGTVTSAKLTLTSPSTGIQKELSVDSDGRFNFANLIPGVYDIQVSAPGFKQLLRRGIAISFNSTMRLDISLELGAVSEQVNVTGSIQTLQSDSADIHIELSSKEVTSLPLTKYRNFQSLINLSPGVTPGRFQNANTDTPARGLTSNVNGVNRNNNATRLDGAVNIFLYLPHHVLYVPPAETIDNVNIATNNFGAEQGMAGGAAINVLTKSGSNEFHGTAFAYHENSAWGARNFFFQGNRTPKNLVTIPGFTLGGPILKNKLFFFTGWEGLRERVNRSRIQTVAPADMRRGDFSAYNFPIYDPSTGTADGRNRTPFAGNLLPASRLSPISLRLQNLLPQTNLTPSNANGALPNFFNAASQVMNRDNYDAKVNFNRTSSHTVWAKYSTMRALVVGQPSLGDAIGQCLCDGGTGDGNTIVHLATIGQTWTLTPNLILDSSLGFTRLAQTVFGADYGRNTGLEVLGVPGTNGPDPRQSGFPSFAVAGFATLGNTESWQATFRNDQTFSLSQNFTFIRGSHDLRFGYDGIRHHLNHWQPQLGSGPRGGLSFTSELTGLNGRAVGNPNSWAGLLLGGAQTAGKSIQNIKLTTMEMQHGLYIRDRWRATRRLTLILGLRWEQYPLLTRANYGGVERYNETDNTVSIGGIGGNPKSLGITTSNALFAPRIGAAFSVNSNTVVRAGYGIAYNPMPYARPWRGFFPLTIAQTFAPSSTEAGFAPAYFPVTTLTQGIPAVVAPDLSSGRVTLPLAAQMRTISSDELVRGAVHSWNLTLERRLPWDFIVSTAYVATRTVNGFGNYDVNAAPAGGGLQGQPLFVRFQRNQPLQSWNGQLDADYHSLQIAVNRRFAQGLTLKGAYTWSKAMNETDDDGLDGVGWNHTSVRNRNRALAGYDTPHIFQLAYSYNIPFLAANRFLGGWQANGNASFTSGRPFTVSAAAGSLNAPGNTQTADQVKAVVEKIGTVEQYYDRSAFAPVTGARFGSSGRNLLRGPGFVNFDLSLFKSIPLPWERIQLQFRAEAFNLTNTPHFNNPSANVSAGDFMRITSTLNDERTMRFGLRFSF